MESREDRLAVARLSGSVQRLFHLGIPAEEAVAELREITTRPDLLGYVAGHCLADEHWPSRGRGCAELLFAAGGDREAAERSRADLVARQARAAVGDPSLRRRPTTRTD